MTRRATLRRTISRQKRRINALEGKLRTETALRELAEKESRKKKRK